MSICELPEGITLVDGPLPEVHVATPAAEGRVAVQGAHITHWQPAGAEPVLWMSKETRRQPGAPIRGGIPVCFPWFGPGRLEGDAASSQLDPGHGWARITDWNLVSARVDDAGVAELVWEITGEMAQGQPHADLFPLDATLRYTMTFGPDLRLSLEVIAGEVLVDVEQALHTYFAIDDLDGLRIEGLDGAPYIDKVTGDQAVHEGDLAIRGEVDRVHDSSAPLRIVDAGRTLRVTSTGTESIIVWNPWVAKSAVMSDFGDEEFREMVCVESGNVMAHAVTVPPGQNHVMTVQYSVE